MLTLRNAWQAFSQVKLNNSSIRSQLLTGDHKAVLHLSATSIKPDSSKLVMQHHPSH